MEKIRAVKGMPDITPPSSARWARVESLLASVLKAYGYGEIRMPLVESTALFQRSIGEVTDIVEKEMYTFADRKQRSLSLRPEGTAGCVRACIENRLLDTPQKLWYSGPMFRYENPQKGRQRQFHQLGAEALGYAEVPIEFETLLMQQRFWTELGLADRVRLEINSIGSLEARASYRQALIAYLSEYESSLDADSQRRLHENPLRILDSKVPATQAILQDAPELADFLDAESRQRFELLCSMLTEQGIEFVCNPRLVRGLDYYNDTVFEWVSDALGAQATLCAGGRYDGLVEQLGGKPTPAFGFAIGLERLLLVLDAVNNDEDNVAAADIYLVVAEPAYQARAFAFAEQLRSALPKRSVVQQLQSASIKSQFKRADKLGASHVLIMAEQEYAEQTLTVKDMRNGEQQSYPMAEALAALVAALAD